MGLPTFAQEAKAAGIYAVLVVDLPPEEATHYSSLLASAGLKTVFLASPTTPPERIAKIGTASTGFIYYVSRAGVTGIQSAVSLTLADEVAEVRKLTSQPLAIGFGVSNGEQAAQVSGIGDAVVVGSALVKCIEDDPEKLVSLRALAKEIRAAIPKLRT